MLGCEQRSAKKKTYLGKDSAKKGMCEKKGAQERRQRKSARGRRRVWKKRKRRVVAHPRRGKEAEKKKKKTDCERGEGSCFGKKQKGFVKRKIPRPGKWAGPWGECPKERPYLRGPTDEPGVGLRKRERGAIKKKDRDSHKKKERGRGKKIKFLKRV